MTEVDPVKDVIVAQTGKDLAEFAGVDDEVVAGITEDHVFFVAARDGVIAVAALDHVGAAKVGDDVITGSAFDGIGAVAALDAVIAVAAVDRIVADAADDRIVARRSPDGDMVATGVLDDAGRIGNIDVGRQGRHVSDHQRCQFRVAHGIGIGAIARGVELLALVNFQNMVLHRKDVER